MAALARELARRHSVTVLTSRALHLPAESLEEGVRVLRVPVFFRRELAVANAPSMLAYLPMGALRALSLRSGRQFDLINTHFVVPTGPLGQFLATRFDVPNVLSVHGGDLYDPSKRSSPHRHWWLRVWIRRLLLRADAIVGQSRDTLARVEQIYGVQRRTELVPLGIVRPPAVSGIARDVFGLPTDAFVMVTVGRLVARKATEQLLDVLQHCGRPTAHLLIVGDGPELESIRRGAQMRGVAQRVHLAGQVDDAQKFAALSLADVFVSTSQHEGFGLVFLEAMAYGLPIVCYDRGGQSDFLRTGETGSVVALNDRAAFTRAVIDLHDDLPLRRRLGDNNRRYLEEYLIERCAQRYEAVFETALRNRRDGMLQQRAASSEPS